MNINKGFTLIELIIVIVILGVLAVTAAPKFLDIQTDAKASTVEGVLAAVKTNNTSVHAKALIRNQNGPTGSVQVSGVTVALANGYPNDVTDISSLLDTDISVVFESGDGGTAGDGQPGDGTSALRFYGWDDTNFDYSNPATENTGGEGCLIIYTATSNSNTPPTAVAYTAGCV